MVAGHRCYPGKGGRCILGMGDFGKNVNDVWWVRLPETGNFVSLLDLATPVTEHSDKSISVGGPLKIRVLNGDGSGGEIERTWKLDHGKWEKTEKVV